MATTFNNNGDVPLYDVTVADATTDGTGSLTGLSCTFPDTTTGLYFAGPLEVGDVVTCIGILPALGDGATHQDTVTVWGRAGLTSGGQSAPDPQNPPTGLPISQPGTGIVTDTDQFNVVTPGATTTTTTTTEPTTTTTLPTTTTTTSTTTTTPGTTTEPTVPPTVPPTEPEPTTTIPDTTTTTMVPEVVVLPTIVSSTVLPPEVRQQTATEEPPVLSRTGLDLGPLLAIAGGLLAAGISMVVAGRRRRQSL